MRLHYPALRRRNAGEIDPEHIAAFLLLERNFPRSVAFAACRAHDAIGKISNELSPALLDPAEAILGRLTAELQYMQPAEVEGDRLGAFLQKVQGATLEAGVAVRKSYFLQ